MCHCPMILHINSHFLHLIFWINYFHSTFCSLCILFQVSSSIFTQHRPYQILQTTGTNSNTSLASPTHFSKGLVNCVYKLCPSALYTRPRGSHLYVACKTACNRDQVFWPAKSVLERLIISFWGSLLLDFQVSKVKLQPHILYYWLSAVWRSPWSFDQSPKRALTAWFNFDPGHKHFYTEHVTTSCRACETTLILRGIPNFRDRTGRFWKIRLPTM